MGVAAGDEFAAQRSGIVGKVTASDLLDYLQDNLLAVCQQITAADLSLAVTGSTLVAGRIYQITDETFIAVATSANTYDTFHRISVGTTAPSTPVVNDLWVDTN